MSLIYAPVPVMAKEETPQPPAQPQAHPVIVNTGTRSPDIEKYIPHFLLILAIVGVALLFEIRSALVELRLALRSRAYASI